jgi:hypothetical protein
MLLSWTAEREHAPRDSQPYSKCSARYRCWMKQASPGSHPPLLGASSLRTGRDSYPAMQLRPCERLCRGDAVSRRKDAGDETCRGTLDEVKHGSRPSASRSARGARDNEEANPRSGCCAPCRRRSEYPETLPTYDLPRVSRSRIHKQDGIFRTMPPRFRQSPAPEPRFKSGRNALKKLRP